MRFEDLLTGIFLLTVVALLAAFIVGMLRSSVPHR
jgi:hypothetical protein